MFLHEARFIPFLPFLIVWTDLAFLVLPQDVVFRRVRVVLDDSNEAG
jgi:hypothetical protein